jgi:hypothetical protein
MCKGTAGCSDTNDPYYEALKWELGFDGSEINKIHALTANVRIPTKRSPKAKKHWEVITIRGCYYCVGKSAKLETEALEDFFANDQKLLRDWRELHEQMYPGEAHGIRCRRFRHRSRQQDYL